MGGEERVVARFNDGRVVKGFTKDLGAETDVVVLTEAESGKEHRIPFADLKALFFIKSFEGDRDYHERKTFGISANEGRKVFIRFKDGESLVGFVDGDIPWGKGFFLTSEGSRAKGFFLIPVDRDSNNEKVFVVGNSVQDVTIMVR